MLSLLENIELCSLPLNEMVVTQLPPKRKAAPTMLKHRAHTDHKSISKVRLP